MRPLRINTFLSDVLLTDVGICQHSQEANKYVWDEKTFSSSDGLS